MLRKIDRKTVLLVFALPLFVSTAAVAGDIKDAIKLCDANPSCSYGAADADGGILFKVKLDDGVARLYCAADGECARLYPRSQRVAMDDPTSVMALTRVLALK
jgi:hypothetical protein